MDRQKAINAFLAELSKFGGVLVKEFEGVNFYEEARRDLEGDSFRDETICTLTKLLISAELWLRDFAETRNHTGILYAAQFVGYEVNQVLPGRSLVPISADDIEVRIYTRRHFVLKNFNVFPLVRMPEGVSTIDIAMTVTSILDAAIQPFMESSGWTLGELPDIIPQLMHPRVDDLFQERFGSAEI